MEFCNPFHDQHAARAAAAGHWIALRWEHWVHALGHYNHYIPEPPLWDDTEMAFPWHAQF
jgi:hypothetical protein